MLFGPFGCQQSYPGPVWPYKTFKFLSMLITGHYPAGFFMLVYLLEKDSPLVTLMPFYYSLPTTPHLHQESRPRQM